MADTARANTPVLTQAVNKLAFRSLALFTVTTERSPPLDLGSDSTPLIGTAVHNATRARFPAPQRDNSSLAAAAATVSGGGAFPAELTAHGTQWTREAARGLVSHSCSLGGMMGALKQSPCAKPRATVWYFIDAAIRLIEELVAFNAFNRDKDGALSILIVLHWIFTNPCLWLFVVTSVVHIFIISCTQIPKLIARSISAASLAAARSFQSSARTAHNTALLYLARRAGAHARTHPRPRPCPRPRPRPRPSPWLCPRQG